MTMAKQNDRHRESREQQVNEESNRAFADAPATGGELAPNRDPDQERHNAAVSQEPEDLPSPSEARHEDATRPWDKPSSNVPWSMDLLRAPVSQKRKGFVTRWVTEMRIPMREAQGYRIADPKAYGVTPDRNGRISRNELVLMEIPDDVYDKRRLGIQEFTDRQTRSTKAGVRKAARDIERQSGHRVEVEDDEDEE